MNKNSLFYFDLTKYGTLRINITDNDDFFEQQRLLLNRIKNRKMEKMFLESGILRPNKILLKNVVLEF
ncbi:hypothetical protein ACM55M_02355 [Flavobacterium sp. ZT3R25]|uniref:hypothetical protein n=1 Tax=Flavobacterium galactosi TaxID=3398735 RepID=UPI003A8954FA